MGLCYLTTSVLAVFCLLQVTWVQTEASKDGYKLLYTSNRKEFSDAPVKFTKPFPDWLKGTYVRNGPGQFEMGKRAVLHSFDGFAKLVNWKFMKNGSVSFSTKFMDSLYYIESVNSDDIAPFTMMYGTKPPFNVLERILSFINGMDNMVVNVFDFPEGSSSPRYAAMTDFWLIYEICPLNLTTVSRIQPSIKNQHKFDQKKSPAWVNREEILKKLQSENLDDMKYSGMLSISHPLPEPGTKNRLTVLVNMGQTNKIQIVRMTSITDREIIAGWETTSLPLVHSFSVTQTKAVVLLSPLYANTTCIVKTVIPMLCVEWKGEEPSTLHVVDLATGNITVIHVPSSFVFHHINAYDDADGKITMDVSAFHDPPKVLKLMLDTMRADDRNLGDIRAHVERYSIDVKQAKFEMVNLDVAPTPSLANYLDFPVINENFRFQSYCFVYGVTVQANSSSPNSQALVKKDMCKKNATFDSVLFQENHYPGEPWFVPRPGGTREDDGILLSPILDGDRGLTYVAIIEPKNMTIISRGYSPTYVPFAFHGRFFPDLVV